jgi:hypothetical protein
MRSDPRGSRPANLSLIERLTGLQRPSDPFEHRTQLQETGRVPLVRLSDHQGHV